MSQFASYPGMRVALSPLATSQPQAPTGVILLPLPWPCSKLLPSQEALPAAEPQGSRIPLPKPQILLVAGKGFPDVSLQLAGTGLKPLEKSGGREEGWEEGRKELCLLLAAPTRDGLPRGLPQGAAGSEGAEKQEGKAGRAGAEGQGFICTSSISWAPASAPLAPLIPLLPRDPACCLPPPPYRHLPEQE